MADLSSLMSAIGGAMNSASAAIPRRQTVQQKTEKDPGEEASNKMILKMAEKALENKDATQFKRLIPALKGAGYNENAIDAMGTTVMNQTPMEKYRKQQENTILGMLTGTYDQDQRNWEMQDLKLREKMAIPTSLGPRNMATPGDVADDTLTPERLAFYKENNIPVPQTQQQASDNLKDTVTRQNMEHIEKHANPDYLPEDNPLVQMFRDDPDYLKRYFAGTIAGMPADKIQPYTVQQEKEWYQELERVQNANPGIPMTDAMNQTIVKTRMFPKSASNLQNVPIDQKLLHSDIIVNQALSNEQAFQEFQTEIYDTLNQDRKEGDPEKKLSADEYKKLFLVNVLNDMQQAGRPLDENFQAMYDAATGRMNIVANAERKIKTEDQAVLDEAALRKRALSKKQDLYFNNLKNIANAKFEETHPTAQMTSAVVKQYASVIEHSNTIDRLNTEIASVIKDPVTGAIDYNKLQVDPFVRLGAKIQNTIGGLIHKVKGTPYTDEEKDKIFATIMASDSEVWQHNVLSKAAKQLTMMMYDIGGKQLSDKEVDQLMELFLDPAKSPKFFVQSLISLQENIKNKTASMHEANLPQYKRASSYQSSVDKIVKADNLATTLNIDPSTGESLQDSGRIETQQPEPDQMMPAHQQQQQPIVHDMENPGDPIENGKPQKTADEIAKALSNKIPELRGLKASDLAPTETKLRAMDTNGKELPVGFFKQAPNGEVRIYAGDGFWYEIVGDRGGR